MHFNVATQYRAPASSRIGFEPRRLTDHFLLAALLLFLLADLPAVLGLTEQDNRLFVIAVPYLLVLALGYLVIRRTIPAEPVLAWTIGVAVLLYATSHFSATVQHPAAQPHLREWMVQKTGFLVTLLLVFASYGLVRRNTQARNQAILDTFAKIALAIITASFFVYLLANFVPFLPQRVIAYGEQSLTLLGRTWSRFGATMKEPSEFAFLCVFLVTYLITRRRFVQAAALGFISVFSFSNFLSIGYLFVLAVALGVKVAPRLVVPGLAAVFGAAGIAFYMLGPNASAFWLLDTITPRSYSLLSFRPETPQRLWGNVIAVKEFLEFDWPLGGGGGFLRAYTRDFYHYTVYKSSAPGTGVFRFLMDFGLFALPVLGILGARLHKRIVTTVSGSRLGAKILILLCVFYMSVRTGYLNLSVWTMLLLLYYAHFSPGRATAQTGTGGAQGGIETGLGTLNVGESSQTVGAIGSTSR